jgi:hypothetical protein
VFLLEDGTRVEGTVTVPRRGVRLSDHIAQSDREFFTISSAKVTLPTGETNDVGFVMIARRFVKMVVPGADETPDAQP